MTRAYGQGEQLFVIENVPVATCRHRGESYLQSETLHELEGLKRHRKRLAK